MLLQVLEPEGVEQVVAGMNSAYELDRGYRVAHHGADLLPPELGVMNGRVIEAGVILGQDGLGICCCGMPSRSLSPAPWRGPAARRAPPDGSVSFTTSRTTTPPPVRWTSSSRTSGSLSSPSITSCPHLAVRFSGGSSSEISRRGRS